MEFLFWLDFFFCFCQEYIDEQTFMVVSDIKIIAKHYSKGSCIYDLLACIPFAYIFHDSSSTSETSKERLFKLFKLLRIPRLMGLLDVERVKKIINERF